MAGTLDVWWGQRRVGRLVQDQRGALRFTYAPEWLDGKDAPALSASLPKREAPFTRRECRPFFAGLLPDEGQRTGVARALGVSAGNDFSLLERLGGDVAGALQLLPADESPWDSLCCPRPESLDDAELVRVLDVLPTRPLLAGERHLRSSLAGAQPKLPVVLVQGAVALPAYEQPTTHILKPAIAGFPGTTENEAFAMRLAAAIELDVAPVEARTVEGRTYLLVERYDRVVTPRGVSRVHQEDFCQALGIPPERKYAGDGGPAFRDCFALVRRVAARPAVDVLKLLDAAIFNLIVGNADAHGKNFSLLHESSGARFAPLYDLLATVAYKDLSPRLAMRMGRRGTLEEMDARSWALFASAGGVSLPLVRRRVAEVAERVQARAEEVAERLSQPGLDEGMLADLARTTVRRARRCAGAT